MEVNIYIGIMDLEGEVHSIWDLWVSGIKNARAMSFFKIGRVGSSFRVGPKNCFFFKRAAAPPNSDSPKISLGGS